jgi:excisionase family DNA binding protein
MAVNISNEWVTAKEAARHLGVDETLIRLWLRTKLLQGEKFGPLWKVKLSDLKNAPEPKKIGRRRKGITETVEP